MCSTQNRIVEDESWAWNRKQYVNGKETTQAASYMRLEWSHNCNIIGEQHVNVFGSAAMNLLHLRVVLAAIDSDESSLNVLRGAHELVTAAGASLHVVSVAPAVNSSPATNVPGADEHRNTIAQVLNRADVPASEVSLHLLAGDPVHAIRSVADKVSADVIVLGRHRGGSAEKRALGSTALAVVTNSWAPCLILSQGMSLPLERVLVPVDLSDTSRGALVMALSWASALRGASRIGESASGEAVQLTALVVDKSSAPSGGATGQTQMLDDELNRLRNDAGTWASVDITGVVRAGSDVPATIAEYATGNASDLIVLGTRGLGLDDVGRLGSVSLEVARRVMAPILLVPPAVWRAYSKRE
jgi:nucleotide-binding universal stress UspA family protein